MTAPLSREQSTFECLPRGEAYGSLRWGLRPQVFPPAIYHDQRGAAASNFNSRQDIPKEDDDEYNQ